MKVENDVSVLLKSTGQYNQARTKENEKPHLQAPQNVTGYILYTINKVKLISCTLNFNLSSIDYYLSTLWAANYKI